MVFPPSLIYHAHNRICQADHVSSMHSLFVYIGMYAVDIICRVLRHQTKELDLFSSPRASKALGLVKKTFLLEVTKNSLLDNAIIALTACTH